MRSGVLTGNDTRWRSASSGSPLPGAYMQQRTPVTDLMYSVHYTRVLVLIWIDILRLIEGAKDASPESSYIFLSKELPVRLANIMKEFCLLPERLLQTPSVKQVEQWWVSLYCHYGWRRSVVVSALSSINVVNRHWARLVLGWVTVCGRVNHLT